MISSLHFENVQGCGLNKPSPRFENVQGCGMNKPSPRNSGKLALLCNNKFENKNAGFVEFIVAIARIN